MYLEYWMIAALIVVPAWLIYQSYIQGWIRGWADSADHKFDSEVERIKQEIIGTLEKNEIITRFRDDEAGIDLIRSASISWELIAEIIEEMDDEQHESLIKKIRAAVPQIEDRYTPRG